MSAVNLTPSSSPLWQAPSVDQRLAQPEYVKAGAEEINWDIEVWALGDWDDKINLRENEAAPIRREAAFSWF